ncbi:MAG: hypothetical protein LCH95_15535 [Proteobacteria bacterium]|nr:hypothetical protein [Pseudomonadota bacterium]
MDKTDAAKLEGLLLGGRLHLHAIADHVRDHVPEEDRRAWLLKIGTAMAELLQVSWTLYERHPGLDPYPEETRLAEQMRRDPGNQD